MGTFFFTSDCERKHTPAVLELAVLRSDIHQSRCLFTLLPFRLCLPHCFAFLCVEWMIRSFLNTWKNSFGLDKSFQSTSKRRHTLILTKHMKWTLMSQKDLSLVTRRAQSNWYCYWKLILADSYYFQLCLCLGSAALANQGLWFNTLAGWLMKVLLTAKHSRDNWKLLIQDSFLLSRDAPDHACACRLTFTCRGWD